MKMKLVFTSFLLFAFSTISPTFAQTAFDVPQNVNLNTREDYTRFENDVINASRWLEETDLDKEIDKRKEVNAFVLQWVSGTPNFTIDLTGQLQKLFGKNAQLIVIYLAVYSRYVLENKGFPGKFYATKTALLSIMKVYQKGIAINKGKEMERLIKQSDENKLDEFIATTLKTAKD